MTKALPNLLGIQDADVLREIESGFVQAREIGLNEVPLPPRGWPLLSAIHRHLFQDVYAWAGQLRTEDMTKMSMDDILSGSISRSGFTTHTRLVDALDSFFAKLDVSAFRHASDEGFVTAFAVAYEALNRHHPFREGNGRTQRRYWDITLRGSGRRIDWESGQTRIHDASRATDSGDLRPLEDLIRVMLRADDVT